jgi:hypothetical protein
LKTDFGAGFGWVVNATPPPGFNPWTVWLSYRDPKKQMYME